MSGKWALTKMDFLKRFKIPISARSSLTFQLYFVIEMTKCNELKTEKKCSIEFNDLGMTFYFPCMGAKRSETFFDAQKFRETSVF